MMQGKKKKEPHGNRPVRGKDTGHGFCVRLRRFPLAPGLEARGTRGCSFKMARTVWIRYV